MAGVEWCGSERWGAVVVVVLDEGVDVGLQLVDGGGGQLGAEPFLHCLLEAFDLAAGGGVVGSRVLLANAALHEFGFEAVA